jgi:hypothetical protein
MLHDSRNNTQQQTLRTAGHVPSAFAGVGMPCCPWRFSCLVVDVGTLCGAAAAGRVVFMEGVVLMLWVL